MSIDDRVNDPLSPDVFSDIDLLRASTLAERRPIDDRECIQGMLRHSNLTVTAWDGTRLQALSQAQLGARYHIILLAAPAANACENIGLSSDPRCWVLERRVRLG